MQTTVKTMPFKAVKDILILAYRNLLKIKHTPDKLLDVTLMPIFFTVMFTYLFGGAIAGDTKAYLPIVIPGILIQTLLSSSSGTGTQLRQDMETGVFDRFKSLPIARIAPLAGPIVSDFLRYMVAGAIVLSTGYILGYRPEAGIWWTILAILLAIVVTWSVSWVFATIGLLVKNSGTIQALSMTVSMILSFMSSAFVPINTFPSWLKVFAQINPVTHMISAFKEMANNGVLGQDAVLSLLSSAVIIAIFAPLTLKLYSRNA